MATKKISQLNETAESLNNEDLLLVSVKNLDGTYTSKKVLASSIGATGIDKNKLDNLYENLKDVKLNISEDNSLILTIGTNKYRILVTQLDTVESVQV